MSEYLKRKWSFKVKGHKHVLIKRPQERAEHVYMKILLAQLYSEFYDDIRIEVRHEAEQRYKPDLLVTNLQGEAIFWGECGEVSQEKLFTIIKKYRNTHFCFSKWHIKADPFISMIDKAVSSLKKPRTAPVDFINFPDEARNYITENGEIAIRWGDVDVKHWE